MRMNALAILGAATLAAGSLATAVADHKQAGITMPIPIGAAKEEAQVVTLQPVRDNTLYESVDGTVSNGQGSHLFVGNSNSAVIRRAVLEFDLTAAIPANAEIDQVSLQLNMSRTSSGDETVRLHRLSAGWGEGSSNAADNEGSGAPAESGDATWIHTLYPSEAWAAPGGDFVATPSASTVVAAIGRYEWTSNDMEDEVEAWLSDPSSNHGWILIGHERGSGGEKLQQTSKRFDSKDNTDTSVRPVLVVEYRVDDSTSTPETSTPETSTPETSTPETSTPETSTPETSTPETSTPETSTPETSTPETSTPETSTPETSTPETSTPETSTPETSTPETSTPETSTPETSTPETGTPPTPTPATASPVPDESRIYLPVAKKKD